MRFNRELPNGNPQALVLAIPGEGPLHGYEVAKELGRRGDDALRLVHSLPYPTLDRLEAQGLIAGEWEQMTGTPTRTRDVITERGRDELRAYIEAEARQQPGREPRASRSTPARRRPPGQPAGAVLAEHRRAGDLPDVRLAQARAASPLVGTVTPMDLGPT